MALAADPIAAAERARRVRVYEEALASLRLEGFEIDDYSTYSDRLSLRHGGSPSISAHGERSSVGE